MDVLTQARTVGMQRTRLLVTGVVQGVGFRPFVHKLARRAGLSGFVQNGPAGVVIEIEGRAEQVEEFLIAFQTEAPPLVRIGQIERSELGALGIGDFHIRPSEAADLAFTLVPPDICVCKECLEETRDPENRRFDYPFTNCTNCGPRYSIILDIPYDRPLTTMAGFAMCEDCRREYEDPEDRRFHAQPNACPVCGPQMRLLGRDGVAWSETEPRRMLERVAGILCAGGIVAWKGLGGYQLACDARQAGAVEELRRRKQRNDKAFAVMVADVEAAERICHVSMDERTALTSRERPIVLLKRRADAGLAEAVSPANPLTGVMLPCTPMHDLLFRVLDQGLGNGAALVMTSGNVSEEPIVIAEEAAQAQLAGIADVFVHHDRPIHTRVDDSVVRLYEGRAMLLRRARGYAPNPIWLGRGELEGGLEILAVGAQQKSAFCLTKAGFALLSQHLGDLENYETLEFYEQTLQRMKKLFHANPAVVAHDLHPDYLSTRLARQMDSVTHVPVQHHHAHIAACMAEHGLEGQVIGVAWDGTGYGTDGTIWGGEFLATRYTGFDRYAHLRNVPLAGGDAAVREPWRVGRSYLLDAYGRLGKRGSGEDGGELPQVSDDAGELPSREKVRLIDTLLERNVYTIETSSCGRLFDAVAALIKLRQVVSFEGQAAMELEALAGGVIDCEPYEFGIHRGKDGSLEVDLRALIRAIVQQMQEGVAASAIAARFHRTLVEVVVTVSLRMREELGLTRVCLGGGCFQNMLLLDGCVQALRGQGFEVFYPVEVPANDGGIALGQAAIATEMMRSDKARGA